MENVKSCSLAELENMEQETYQLLDIRSMEAFDHGHLKDALNIPANELIERKDELQTEKKIIVYCQSGVISTDQAELLSGFGFDACSLEGGYDKWLLNHFQETARNADIEKSIRKNSINLFSANLQKRSMNISLSGKEIKLLSVFPAEGFHVDGKTVPGT